MLACTKLTERAVNYIINVTAVRRCPRQEWLITPGFCDRRNGVQMVKLHGSNSEPLMSALGLGRVKTFGHAERVEWPTYPASIS